MDACTMETVIRKFVQAYPRYISFCWHGGEPLFNRTPGFYEFICETQERYRFPGQEIENRIQTNGTLITKEWAEFFGAHDFGVCVSIDGPEWLNDGQRVGADGKGTFRDIERGIGFLREFRVPFSVIAVITNKSVRFPEEIYAFVVREDFTSVSLNPCFGNGLAVDPMAYAHFMNRIFDLWTQDDRDTLSFGLLENILTWFYGGTPNVCHLRNSCYRHAKVDYNGDVVPCDTFLGESFLFGNLIREELTEIVNGKNYRDFHALTTSYVTECRECEWLELCNGGCSRYSIEPTFTKHASAMCQSRKLIFEHVAQAYQQACGL